MLAPTSDAEQTGADSLPTTRSSRTTMYRRQRTHQHVPASTSRQSYAHFSPRYAAVRYGTVRYASLLAIYLLKGAENPLKAIALVTVAGAQNTSSGPSD